MAQSSSIEDLDAPGEIRHQRREWTVERMGWGVMAMVLLAAILGGLGPGPLTFREARSADESLRVRFYAVERYEAPCSLELLVNEEGEGAATIDVAFSRKFADETSPELIVPKPIVTTAQGDRIVLTFAADGLSRNGKIVYRYKHDNYGPLNYQVSLLGREPVNLRQFVLP